MEPDIPETLPGYVSHPVCFVFLLIERNECILQITDSLAAVTRKGLIT